MRFLFAVVVAAMLVMARAQDSTDTSSTSTISSTSAITTTPAPTTSAPTTASTLAPTTRAPSTTSTAAPTSPAPSTTSTPTTPAPTTHKPPPTPVGPTLEKYAVRTGDENSTICLLVQAKITVLRNDTKFDVQNAKVLASESKCTNVKDLLWITWGTMDDSIQLTVSKGNGSYFISEVALRVDESTADNADLKQFETMDDSFYKCHAVSEVKLNEEFKIVFSEMKYQSFGGKGADKEEFTGKELECVSDYHSDVVIIAVGCAMAALVVVILIAYLIARRRNRQRGYQSV